MGTCCANNINKTTTVKREVMQSTKESTKPSEGKFY